MSFAEVRYFLEGLSTRHREAWEQTRIVGYIIAQANSSKTLKQSDVLRFPWDEEAEAKAKDTFVSDEDVKRLRALAKQYESK